MTTLWKCDFCGGPAVWTLVRDVVYYHCERGCAEFQDGQMELFRDAGVSLLMEGDDPPGLIDLSSDVDRDGLPF